MCVHWPRTKKAILSQPRNSSRHIWTAKIRHNSSWIHARNHETSVRVIGPALFTEDLKFIISLAFLLSLSLSWLHDFRTLSILSKDRKSLDSCWTLGFHTFIRRSPSRGPRKYLAHESKTEIVHLADEITGTY